MVFRSHLPAYKLIPSSYLAYPHTITKCVVLGDKKEFVCELETSAPIIDPLLSANWTDIRELQSNGVSISPIQSYVTSSIEERLSFLNDSVRALNEDMEFVRSQSQPAPPESASAEPASVE